MNNLGFTLLELIVAVMLGSMVMLSGVLLNTALVKETVIIEKREDLRIEFDHEWDRLFQELSNNIYIKPAEDLLVDGDGMYAGVASVGANSRVPDCLYQSGQFSILRFTHLLEKFNPEQILRAWNEDSAGLTTSADELRITRATSASPTTSVDLRMFVDPTPSNELVVVDADGSVIRRTKSANPLPRSPSPLNPFTDLPNPPNSYYYTSVLTGRSYSMNKAPNFQISSGWSFISGSSVFVSKTSYLCVSNTKEELIIYTENLSPSLPFTKEVLIKLDPLSFLFNRFYVDYVFKPKGQPISISDFEEHPALNTASGSLAERTRRSQCISALRINSNILSIADSGQTLRTKVIRLDDATKRMPSMCL